MSQLILEPFNILDHVDRLTLSDKATKSQPYYHCPVCGGSSLTFNKQGKFRCWSGGCDSKAIMEAIRPIKDAIAEAKQKTTKWVKPPRPKATFEFFYPDRNGEKLVKVTIAYSGDSTKKDVRQHWWNGTTWQSFDMPDEIKHQVRLYQIDHPTNQEAIATGKPIIVGESESKVDLCLSIGLAATCNIGGSGKWEAYGGAANLYEQALQGANILLSPDRGRSGLQHCQRIAQDFPNAQWVYADPTNPKWDDLDKRYYLAADGKAPKIAEATQSWLESNLPDIGENDQLWNWLDGDEYDLKNWIEEIADPALAKQMILDAIEPQRPYEIQRRSPQPALLSKPSNVVPINSKSIPPHDLNAEHFVIGQFLLDSSHVAIVLGTHVSPDHFYHPLNREICNAIADLIRGSQPVDVLSVHAMLSRKGFGDKVSIQDLKGYRDRADEFADNDVVFQANVIKDKYLLRTGQTLGRELTKLFTDESKTSKDLTAIAQQKILDFMMQQTSGGEFQDFGTILENYSAEIEADRLANPGVVLKRSLGCGVPEVDSIGEPSENSIVSIYGRPSHGKTTLTFQWAQNIALQYPDKSVLYFSLEVSKESAAIKHAIMNTGLPKDSIRYHDFASESDRKTYNDLISAYKRTNLYVYDTLETVETMCARVRSFIIEKGPVSAVFFDYLQLMEPDNSSFDETKNINACLKALRRLRKEAKVAVFILVQMNRELEKRQDKRPTLADAKQSGNIEQDSDEVIYVYRDEMYNTSSPDAGMIELGKLKSRDGKMGGVVKVPFDGKNSRIGNSFTSLLDRMAASNDMIPVQLQTTPQLQPITTLPVGAIAEPEISEDEFF